MRRCCPWFFSALALLLCGATSALAAELVRESFVPLPTRPGVTLPVALLAPEKPRGAVILLAGGKGNLGISERDGQAVVRSGGNFLVRTRQLFAAQGLAVAVPDAPSDQMDGMGPAFRVSEAHLKDVAALAEFLRLRFGQGVWLVGTSMGSISAGYCAARLGQAVEGVALTSSVTHSPRRSDFFASHPRATLDTGLERIAVPALVVRHQDDACKFSPPGDAPWLLEKLSASPRKALLTFEGGLPAQSDVCEAKSAHGYLGIEAEVVAGIAAFILQDAPTP